MGTVVSVDLRAPDEVETDGAVAAVADRLEEIDEAFSPWLPDSWVSRLIDGRVALEACPADVQRVVRLSLELTERTDGFFSPYWRGAGRAGPDPTGLVKGWAAQQASDVLLAHGLPDHIVNAAGDVVVSGRPDASPDGGPWRVGIADPLRPGQLAGAVELGRESGRWAVATSGTAELGAHVRDPHRGTFPASVLSATVVVRLDLQDEGGATADAWATALVAAGEQASWLLEKLASDRVEGLLIGADDAVCDPRSLLSTL